MKFLKRNINTIFIMLGNSCNMNCVYCVQHPLIHKPIAKKINPDIYDFIEEVAEESSNMVHLQFYGGEPLLYYASIKAIVEETKQRGLALSYGLISNGRAITDEMVRYFNENNIAFYLSWDGYAVMKTRRYDSLADSETRDRLLALNRLGLTGVISSKSYPLEMLEAFQEISDEYTLIHGYPIYLNLDEIIDSGLVDKTLLTDINLKRVGTEVGEILSEFIENAGRDMKQSQYCKFEYAKSLIWAAKDFYVQKKGVWNKYTVACGNGLSTLNMDLDGNLYACHNHCEPIGNIHDGYFAYLQKVLATDNTKLFRPTCEKCVAFAYCRGGCKLVNKENRENGYCSLKQAIFMPVLQALSKYGSTLLEANNGGKRNN